MSAYIPCADPVTMALRLATEVVVDAYLAKAGSRLVTDSNCLASMVVRRKGRL